MVINGVALLAFCYIVGQLMGDLLGKLLSVGANIGGVGFAMLLLVLINDKLYKKGLLDKLTEDGLSFWSQMYIPIIVAMSAIQNVKIAVSSGAIALVVGVVPVLICFLAVPFIAKLSVKTP
jgi:malonate transporter MadL subunit